MGRPAFKIADDALREVGVLAVPTCRHRRPSPARPRLTKLRVSIRVSRHSESIRGVRMPIPSTSLAPPRHPRSQNSPQSPHGSTADQAEGADLSLPGMRVDPHACEANRRMPPRPLPQTGQTRGDGAKSRVAIRVSRDSASIGRGYASLRSSLHEVAKPPQGPRF